MSQEVKHVKKRNGRLEDLDISKINRCAERACDGIDLVSASEVVLDAQVQLFDKITTKEIDSSLIMSARSKVEKEPNYSYVAARLLLATIHKEVFGESRDKDTFDLQYKKSFIKNIKTLVKNDTLDKKLLEFDLRRLSDSLDPDRDLKFKFQGISNLYDRYLIKIDGHTYESPPGILDESFYGLSNR